METNEKKIVQNKTGYPHIDKAHMQFYRNCDSSVLEDKGYSMYDMLYLAFQERKDSIAMEYFGRKITYSEFIHKINEYESAFKNIGIRKGEIVSITAPNLPEVFYSIYALNKIGAVANLIDPRNNIDRIKEYINKANSSRLIMIDLVYPKIAKIINDTELEYIYTISAADSLPLGLNYAQRAKTIVENHRNGLPNCPNNWLYRPLVEVVNKTKGKSHSLNASTDLSESKAQDLAIIITTSGTTGSPKGVMLTNENLNAVALDYMYSGMEYQTGDGFLGIMPNFLAYGIGVGTHMTFVLGLKNIIIPKFEPQDFPTLLMKHKPAHFAGVPSHYQYLIENEKAQKTDFSFIKTAAAGGDAMDPDLKRKVNDFLVSHGSRDKIKIGYGCTENTGMASSQFYVGESTKENELTTVGIPAYFTTFRVVSPETKQDLKYNEDGEILLSGKGVMKGYINNYKETKEVLEIIDGEPHLHTGDIGHIDENGCVYIVDRMKRIIVRPDGHNVFPSYIEKVVTSHPLIKSCVCVGLKDINHINGRVPVAFIVVEPGYEAQVETIINELESLSLQKLPERDVALDYIVLEQLPMTPAGKVDFVTLQETYTYNSNRRIRKR